MIEVKCGTDLDPMVQGEKRRSQNAETILEGLYLVEIIISDSRLGGHQQYEFTIRDMKRWKTFMMSV